jgi:hypothetical protein
MKKATATCDFTACSTSSASSRTLASGTTYPPPHSTSFSKENCRFSLPVPPLSTHLSLSKKCCREESRLPHTLVCLISLLKVEVKVEEP